MTAADTAGLAAAQAQAPAAGAGAAEFAPAKVNLYLHLRGRRADGYHLLESLAVFPRLGDRLWAEPAQRLSLAIDGPFAAGLPADGGNLVLRAAARLAEATGVRSGAALRLEKSLPVASGIGGGSADAAGALRLLARLWGVQVPEGLALGLGADVPVCLAPRARVMSGIGERLAPAPRMPEAWILLVNPLVSVATGAVFAALERREGPPGPPPPPAGFADFAGLVDWLAAQRNDLAPAAIRCCPAIGEVLEALAPAPLARMSGSGATCFALHADRAAALAAAARLRAARPGWWVAAAPLPADPG
ncbi:4-(cytidine 5'-diphospho)-2-C-methyl-D-erythritol kinase [Paralimibaculum aggregatum]|uniref:4-diphosphocytidyl-2-C-methyl-D-erythritol kinase n=1 Tax=Paralimibaculum aggregatum TaxID=3036245 RepID=A0ABQ6LFH6_9RHOB|nr:4-(cytidine 5'-diphospho)-2-C-methyl-D-erythritol kinase [Limibaculum sp. NKW23]GMG82080.1 4-(cytidine 5'-diphospho)-2-C-methyl-D-erythritol kinase [Limibaculum sp. NKW23]